MSCQVRSSIEQIQQIIPCDVQIIISDSKRAEQFETEAGMPVNRLFYCRVSSAISTEKIGLRDATVKSDAICCFGRSLRLDSKVSIGSKTDYQLTFFQICF